MTPGTRIVDVTDEPSFRLIPPCADPGFDHRSCDYWEDADRGSKAARLAWFDAPAAPPPTRPAVANNPFARQDDTPDVNPFAPAGRPSPGWNPFAVDDDEPVANPFAPAPPSRPKVAAGSPPGGLRQLCEGPPGRRRRGGLRAVRATVGLPARATAARAVFTAARRPVARRDHLHRDDGRGTRRWPRRGAGPGSLRRPRGAGLRGGRGLPRAEHAARRDERGDARVLAGRRLRARGRGRALPGRPARAHLIGPAGARGGGTVGHDRRSWRGIRCR